MRSGYNHLRCSTPAKPRIPEASSMKLLGSGVVPLPPLIVNDSEGIVPTTLWEAFDGQPLDMQPTPLFSSHATGSPVAVCAFCRLSQYVVPDVVATLRPVTVTSLITNPNWLLEMYLSVRLAPLAVPEPNVVPPFSPEVMDQSSEVTMSFEKMVSTPNEKPLTKGPPATNVSLTMLPKLMYQASTLPLIGPLSYDQFCAHVGTAANPMHRTASKATRVVMNGLSSGSIRQRWE